MAAMGNATILWKTLFWEPYLLDIFPPLSDLIPAVGSTIFVPLFSSLGRWIQRVVRHWKAEAFAVPEGAGCFFFS